MTMEKQREFITETLRRAASDVGVDIDQSIGGLLYIAEYQTNGDESDFGPDTEEYSKAAVRLWEIHGGSREGRDMLRAVGSACLVVHDTLFLTRKWELEGDQLPDDGYVNLDWEGWDGAEERSLADYTFQVGYAVRCCDEYFLLKSGAPAGDWFASIGRIGAEVRHAPMRELRRWAIGRYRQRTYPSALAASHELRDEVLDHGRKIGASLTKYNAQRTIYGWLLDADKKLPAGG